MEKGGPELQNQEKAALFLQNGLGVIQLNYHHFKMLLSVTA